MTRSVDAEVAREHRTLRVREEARRRLAAEKEDATQTFDAGLLGGHLGRRQNHRFASRALLPSRGRDAGRCPAKDRQDDVELTWLAACSRGKISWQVCGATAGWEDPILNFEVSGPSWRGGPTRFGVHEIDCSW